MAAKKPAKKSAAKKTTAKKSAAKKSAAKKTTAKKTTAKKTTAKKRASAVTDPGGDAAIDPIEMHDESADAAQGDVRTAMVALNGQPPRPMEYEVIDGQAVVEADIVLGSVEQVERDSEILKAELRGEIASSVIITGNQFRWPNCKVPYTIDSSLTNQARVTDAIAHWEEKTSFEFVLRTSSNASQYADYVTFRPSSGCSSSVGKRGGQQFINLAAGCTKGNTIHEIGHAIGLWHEQSREDRDAFVTINWANITSGREHNFNQHITDGDDVGGYDYGSIMHYPRTAFSKNGLETITPSDASAVIGQRTALSTGDIAAANSMCPQTTVVETTKEITKEVVKEWVKERFAETIKERFPETSKELIPETIKERFPEPPTTWIENIRPGRGGWFTNPITRVSRVTRGGFGGAMPFAVRTPSVGGPADQAEAAGAVEAQMQQQYEAMVAEVEGLAEAYAECESNRQAVAEAYEAAVAALAEFEGQ